MSKEILKDTESDLISRELQWYEKVIPVALIPKEYQFSAQLPNGRIQIIDTRIPGWTYDPKLEAEDGIKGALRVCSEVANEEIFGS